MSYDDWKATNIAALANDAARAAYDTHPPDDEEDTLVMRRNPLADSEREIAIVHTRPTLPSMPSVRVLERPCEPEVIEWTEDDITF